MTGSATGVGGVSLPELGGAGASPPPPPPPPPPSRHRHRCRRRIRLRHRSHRRWRAGGGRVGLRGGGLARQAGGPIRSARRASSSTIAVPVLGFGGGALGLVLGGQLDGRRLGLGDRLGERLGGLELVGEVGALGLEIGDQGVEIVGRRGPDAERDARELIALQRVAVGRGVREQGSEHVAAGAGERPHRDLGEIAAQRLELGFLRRDPGPRRGDLVVELVLLVDRDDVVLGEDVGLLLELGELVDDALDLTPLVVDRAGDHVVGVHRRCSDRDSARDEECSGSALHGRSRV